MKIMTTCVFCNNEITIIKCPTRVICLNHECMIFENLSKFEMNYHKDEIIYFIFRRVDNIYYQRFIFFDDRIQHYFHNKNNHASYKKYIMNIKFDMNNVTANHIMNFVDKIDNLRLFQ